MSSVNITEMEGIMRMGVNQETELNSLLTYYRSKVEDCNKERQEWIAKYDECKFDAELKHKLHWEIKHLKDRVEELERALSHHRTALYDERQNYLKLLRQNTELKKRQSEDGRKIQELLSVCEPLESGMVMCKDVRPEITNTFIVNDLNIHKNGSFSGNTTSLADKVKSANSTTAALQKQTKAKKNASLVSGPAEIHTSYELELINLRKLHDMETKNLMEQNSVLKQEIEGLREKAGDKYDSRSEDFADLLEKHSDLEKKHNSLAQEYFSIRMKLVDNEQRVQENNQLLRVKNIFLAEKMKEQEKKYERESKAIEELVAKRNSDFKTKYKQEMRKKEEHLEILKQQYQKIQQIYLTKIKSLEEHLSKLNDKYNDLGKKSKREITYLNAQLKVMEKRVETEQVQKMRLEIQQLEDDERRKADEDEREEQRLKKETSDKKKKRQQEIATAYGKNPESKNSESRNPEKHQSGKFKKHGMKSVQEESEEEDSSAEVDSEDIDNIQKHIQELEDKLGLNN